MCSSGGFSLLSVTISAFSIIMITFLMFLHFILQMDSQVLCYFPWDPMAAHGSAHVSFVLHGYSAGEPNQGLQHEC